MVLSWSAPIKQTLAISFAPEGEGNDGTQPGNLSALQLRGVFVAVQEFLHLQYTTLVYADTWRWRLSR